MVDIVADGYDAGIRCGDLAAVLAISATRRAGYRGCRAFLRAENTNPLPLSHTPHAREHERVASASGWRMRHTHLGSSNSLAFTSSVALLSSGSWRIRRIPSENSRHDQ
jgi:hypothetical protein